MDIKEFLREHLLISAFSVERTLGIPRGTIRLNNDRKIPEKYQQLIIESLSNYSPIHTHVVVEEKKVPEMPVRMQSGDRYYVVKSDKVVGGKYTYRIMVEYADKSKLIKTEAVDNIPDGSIVILQNG